MIKTLSVLALLLAVVSPDPQSQKRVAKIDEIQIDLSSNSSRTFNQKLEQHSNLAFMINVQQGQSQSGFGQFEVTVQNGEKQKVVCSFKYVNNLCVLQKSTQNVSITVSCLKQKCKAKLALSQRLLYHIQGTNKHKNKMLTVPGEIYKLQKHLSRSLIEIHLQKLEDKLNQDDVKIYSNVHVFNLTQVEEIDTNNLVFGLKPIRNNNDQYLYIEGDQAEKNRQLRFSIMTHNDALEQGLTVMDFIETFGRHSNNSYQYQGSVTKHLQIKVRVFAPKQNKNLPFSLTVKGKTPTNSTPTDISTLSLTPIQFKGHRFFDITFITTKSRHQKYNVLTVVLGIQKVQDKALFVEIGVTDVSTSDISVSDHVYFSASENEEIDFAVSPQVKYEIIGLDKQINILTQNNQKYSVSIPTCSLHKGCKVSVKTTKTCENCSFGFDLEKEDIKNSIFYYEVKDHQIEAKIDFEEELYFKQKIEGGKYAQVVVNSPNAIVYAQFENYQRCQIPSSVCHQFAISQQNPIMVHNKEKTLQNLILNIVGLEKTTFKLRFISQINGLEVQLGQKFSYLFDNFQKEIKVNFLVTNQTFKQADKHLYFNLIAPISSLLLTVKNVKGSQMSSTDGYVEFPRKMIKSNKFQLTITKVGQAFLQQYVHMTLVVTTAESGVKLDATTTHYQKYLALGQKKFIMEYQPSQENSINIYTENLERSHSSMKLTIRDLNLENVDQENKPFIEKLLERDNEVIDLDIQLENLDICQEINCELEITIKSQSYQQLEQTITLLHEESVISLDDSIWNSFEINQLSKTNHFFYIPRDKTKTTTILFSTDDRSLYIDYVVYNTKNQVNPQNWPWERHSAHNTKEILSHLTGFQEFKIQTAEIQTCWPSCVVLITLSQANQQPAAKESQLIKAYKILASSTIIQVPQDLKFHVTMKTNEENVLFIQIKNFLKAKQLTFFTDYKVGRAKIVATLLNKGADYKLDLQNKDFVFSDVQTHVPLYLINATLKQYDLKPEETLLKISFVALSNLKMYFQFTSFIKNLYRLNMDDLQVCTLKVGEEIWYEFIPERDFQIKFYRVKGFPLFKIIKCKEQSYIDCFSKHQKLLAAEVQQKNKQQQRTKQEIKPQQAKNNDIEIINQQLKESTAKELQLFVQKNYEYSNQQCEQCLFFIWIYGYAQDVQLSINIRSSSSQIELKEMATINDRIANQKAHHKYLINAEPQLNTIVSFRIMEGSCLLQITDNQNVLHNGTYEASKNNFEDITIEGLGFPTTQESQEDNPLSYLSDIPSALAQGRKIQNKHHILRHLHIKVVSLSSRPIEYLISYSIGFSGVFLEDGSISQKHMMPNIPHTFYYYNHQKNSHPYLSLSSTVDQGHDQTKNQFQTRFFYYPDANNRKVKEQFRPEMPPKKNANLLGQMLTHVYELPAIYELYEIEISTQNFLKLTASVNHRQVVYLPIGFQYLIKLHSNQSIYLVIDRPQSQYLELTIKKCDTSIPNLMYTNDVKEFQKAIYETREDIFNSYEKKLIKSKKGSKTIHLKITAEEFSQSLFTITVVPQNDPAKSRRQKVKAGNNGLLSYKVYDSKVQVQFSPIVCEVEGCTLPLAHYYLLLAPNISNIYGELYCAGNYFVMKYKQKSQIQSSMVIALLPQHYDKDANKYRYVLTLKDEQEFIGVKAMYTENSRQYEVIYLPTEVTTLWGQLDKVPTVVIMVFGMFLAVIIAFVVVVSTKLARKGYRPISETE